MIDGCPSVGRSHQTLPRARLAVCLPACLAIFLTVFLTVSLTGCGSRSPPNSGLRFAMLVNRLSDVWTKGEIEGFEQACRELGAEPLVFDNRMDANTTLSNLDVVIGQGVDGIVISPPDQKISALVVDKAFSADVPVVSLDLRLLDYNNRQLAPHVGVDNTAAGTAMGGWLAAELRALQWLKDRSSTVGVAALTYDSIWDMKLRTDACRQTLMSRLPDLDPDSIHPVDYRSMDAVGALLGMHSLITGHPEVTNWVVFAGNDEGVIGAVRALEQVGLDSSAIGCGIGYGRAMTELSKRDSAFKATVFIDAREQGRTAATHLYDSVMHGKPIPAFTRVESRVVDRAGGRISR